MRERDMNHFEGMSSERGDCVAGSRFAQSAVVFRTWVRYGQSPIAKLSEQGAQRTDFFHGLLSGEPILLQCLDKDTAGGQISLGNRPESRCDLLLVDLRRQWKPLLNDDVKPGQLHEPQVLRHREAVD